MRTVWPHPRLRGQRIDSPQTVRCVVGQWSRFVDVLLIVLTLHPTGVDAAGKPHLIANGVIDVFVIDVQRGQAMPFGEQIPIAVRCGLRNGTNTTQRFSIGDLKLRNDEGQSLVPVAVAGAPIRRLVAGRKRAPLPHDAALTLASGEKVTVSYIFGLLREKGRRWELTYSGTTAASMTELLTPLLD